MLKQQGAHQCSREASIGESGPSSTDIVALSQRLRDDAEKLPRHLAPLLATHGKLGEVSRVDSPAAAVALVSDVETCDTARAKMTKLCTQEQAQEAEAKVEKGKNKNTAPPEKN